MNEVIDIKKIAVKQLEETIELIGYAGDPEEIERLENRIRHLEVIIYGREIAAVIHAEQDRAEGLLDIVEEFLDND